MILLDDKDGIETVLSFGSPADRKPDAVIQFNEIVWPDGMTWPNAGGGDEA